MVSGRYRYKPVSSSYRNEEGRTDSGNEDEILDQIRLYNVVTLEKNWLLVTAESDGTWSSSIRDMTIAQGLCQLTILNQVPTVTEG